VDLSFAVVELTVTLGVIKVLDLLESDVLCCANAKFDASRKKMMLNMMESE